MKKLILASGSPRRKELLEQVNLTFEIIVSDIEEVMNEKDTPANIVQSLAQQKAKDVFSKNKDCVVIGADTIVAIGDRRLGKPKSKEEAVEMLQLLSGNTHSVFTGVAIETLEKSITFYEETKVMFWNLTKKDIDTYIQSGEPFDKAGAYGIQGFGAMLVKKIDGDYFNVVGLPISRTIRELSRFQ
ncbi:septum formation inhibitor Maf [Lottiidibacillus patelloidae]|uniref:dTTP/UTP pyrophosphatase n=1 Tax=Lottiidibacillus patelloidae TaxID=2670334 RepID=A0A263BVY3_9BACI|nr:Maf family protein [Lottiidibacillus patelloidae]OZM57860.1 septum formation inhibitor Maf [Lottiidibacillus patelloidae]